MFKLVSHRTTLTFISVALTIGSAACSTEKQIFKGQENNQSTVTASAPNNTLAQPKITTSTPIKPQSSHNKLEVAQDKAQSAVIISQSALSPDDWKLVVNQWSEAIALVKTVDKNSPQNVIAQRKLTEYQQNLNYAKQQVNVASQKNSNYQAIPPALLTNPDDTTIATMSSAEQPNQSIFQALIKRRVGGTPVIDVLFNGSQQLEMIVDTGASGTVITQQTATALGVKPVTKARANTASARDVEFDIGYLDSIEVGGATINNLPVAIAGPELETGLLGHDFFGDYDITIKRDVVEFRRR